MRVTKILWTAVPVAFLLAAAFAVLGPGPSRKPEVKLRQIVVIADESKPGDDERARQKIEEIHENLKGGADFRQLAIKQSEALNSSVGGDMGWMGEGILPEHLEDVAFRLERGQYSEIIEEAKKPGTLYRIFYIEDRRNF